MTEPPDAVIDDDAMDRGNAAYTAGRHLEAPAHYEAAVRRPGPADDALAPDLYENLGIVYWILERWRPAIRAFLRALDGDLGAREQSLRLLVSCCFHEGLVHDGERLLDEYEARHGAHPQGWHHAGRDNDHGP